MWWAPLFGAVLWGLLDVDSVGTLAGELPLGGPFEAALGTWALIAVVDFFKEQRCGYCER